MARLPRITPVDVPVHVIQRGNNRQVCFVSEGDYLAYLSWLKKYSSRYGIEIHAWVLMTNHAHVLCTPREEDSLSAMMQSLGRNYVRYFNRRYQRSGTLWEGRYKSCLVQEDHYLLEVYRYIELNPVRAKMVDNPGEYAWSSFQCNALGKPNRLCTPHPLYQALGTEPKERRNSYCSLFSRHIDGELLADIRSNTNKGLAIGNQRFKEKIELRTGRRVVAGKRGRPVGQKEQV